MSYISASLKLFHNATPRETASLQFNWHNPSCTAMLPGEKVVATLLIFWNRERCAIQINDETLF